MTQKRKNQKGRLSAVRSNELLERFGIIQEEVRAQVKPIFLWMYDHGIDNLRIHRNDKRAMVTINDVAL